MIQKEPIFSIENDGSGLTSHSTIEERPSLSGACPIPQCDETTALSLDPKRESLKIYSKSPLQLS